MEEELCVSVVATPFNTPEKIKEMLSFDPLLAAEKIAGKSYKDNDDVGLLGLGISIKHSEIKNAMLDSLGDSKYGSDLVEYQDILAELGFELAASFPFQGSSWGGEPPHKETQYIYGHREYGIILAFDSYAGKRVNGGSFHYCWKPNSEGEGARYGITSSGGFESESRIKWRHEPEFIDKSPDDLYWCGFHDCQEAIKFHIQQLLANGTFYPKWPKASQGMNKSGMYFMNYMDWKHPDYKSGSQCPDSYTTKVFMSKYNALPEWCKDIIGSPEKHNHNKVG